MPQRIRYVSRALPSRYLQEGIIVDEVRSYWLVRFDDMARGSVAINKQNVEMI